MIGDWRLSRWIWESVNVPEIYQWLLLSVQKLINTAASCGRLTVRPEQRTGFCFSQKNQNGSVFIFLIGEQSAHRGAGEIFNFVQRGNARKCRLYAKSNTGQKKSCDGPVRCSTEFGHRRSTVTVSRPWKYLHSLTRLEGRTEKVLIGDQIWSSTRAFSLKLETVMKLVL